VFTSISGIAVAQGEHIIIRNSGRTYRYRVGPAVFDPEAKRHGLILENNPITHGLKADPPRRRQRGKQHVQQWRPPKPRPAIGEDRKKKRKPSKPRQELY